MMSSRIRHMRETDLSTYFEYLDMRGPSTPGQIDAAAGCLRNCWQGMLWSEARAIARSWDRTWSHDKAAERRAHDVLEAA